MKTLKLKIGADGAVYPINNLEEEADIELHSWNGVNWWLEITTRGVSEYYFVGAFGDAVDPLVIVDMYNQFWRLAGERGEKEVRKNAESQ